MRPARFVLLVPLAGQVPDFLLHHGLHQRQSRLPQQVAHALLQQADYVGQWQDHLNVGVLVGSDPAELLHGSLLLDLVSSLHSDSLLFLGRKNQPSAYYGRQFESRYFLRSTGHRRLTCHTVSRNRTRRKRPTAQSPTPPSSLHWQLNLSGAKREDGWSIIFMQSSLLFARSSFRSS